MFQSTHRSLAIKSTLFVLICHGPLGCVNLEAPEEGSPATAEQGLALTESQAWLMPANGPLVLDTCWEGAKSADGSSLGLVAPEPPPATAAQDTTSVDGQERLALVRDTVKGGWARYARVVYTGWDLCTSKPTERRTTPGPYAPDPIGENLRVAVALGAEHCLVAGSRQCPWNDRYFVPKGGRAPSAGHQAWGGVNSTFGSLGDRMPAGIGLNLYETFGRRRLAANEAELLTAITYTALHEFGHALGFYHEHARDDWDNSVYPREDVSRAVYPWWDPSTHADYGAPDVDSVMRYYAAPRDPVYALSPGDIAGVQRIYGRHIAGSLVSTKGNCLAAEMAKGDGEVALLDDCLETRDDQEWRSAFVIDPKSQIHAHRRLTLVGTNESFNLMPRSVREGAKVGLRAARTSESGGVWAFEEVELRGWGGLCLELVDGNTTTGNTTQLWECDAAGGAHQRWTWVSSGQLKYGDSESPYCATLNRHNRLVIGTCRTDVAGQRFTFAKGRIRTQSGLCLDTDNVDDATYLSGVGGPVNGLGIQALPCGEVGNRMWNFSGKLQLVAEGNLCLARPAGADMVGGVPRLASCDAEDDQLVWDYYF